MENTLRNEETQENEVVEPEVVDEDSKEFNVDVDSKDVAIGVVIGTGLVIGVAVLVKKVIIPSCKKIGSKAKDLVSKAKKKTEESVATDGDIIDSEVVEHSEEDSLKN